MKVQKVIINGIECILSEDPRIIIKSRKYRYRYSIVYKKLKPAVIVKYNTAILDWYGNIFSVTPLLTQDKNMPIKKWEVDPCQKIF